MTVFLLVTVLFCLAALLFGLALLVFVQHLVWLWRVRRDGRRGPPDVRCAECGVVTGRKHLEGCKNASGVP